MRAPPRLRPARRRLPPRAPQGSPETEDLLRKADERRRRESFGGSSDGHVAEVEDCARAIDSPVDPMMESSDGASDDESEAAAPAAETAATDSVDCSVECASEAPVPTSAAVLPPTGVTPTPRARGLLFLFARCCLHDDD